MKRWNFGISKKRITPTYRNVQYVEDLKGMANLEFIHFFDLNKYFPSKKREPLTLINFYGEFENFYVE